MENQREQEWAEAQKIVFSEDLITAAKHQLKFLANVDKYRQLYDHAQTLTRAIYRYKHCWLPLLARTEGTKALQGPLLLVVPLDCEWIWHCHRLNPVRYKVDCVKLYGKILGTNNIVSSFDGGVSTEQTQVIWNRMYPNEPYALDMTNPANENDGKYLLPSKKSTAYDLVSAVKRQTSFFYQVSRPCMKDELFLEGAVARYKGFLHLIKRNAEMGIKRFCVPTYDIDLIWHSHQLNPTCYCKDSVALLGWVLPHDDTDSNRSKGEKLDVGFSGTTKQWEETFGLRYWRAGSMYRGSAPTPLDMKRLSDVTLTMAKHKQLPLVEYQNLFHLPTTTMLMEVMVELVGVKEDLLLFEHNKGSVFISLSKKQPDKLFKAKRRMTIFPESQEKQVVTLDCEPTGDFLVELISSSSSTLSSAASENVLLGTSWISLKEILGQASTLSCIEKWLELAPNMSLGLAFSFTAPIKAAGNMLHIVGTRKKHLLWGDDDEYSNRKNWLSVVDEAGNKILSVQMRGGSKKQVVCRTQCGEERVVAEAVEGGWWMMGSRWFLHPCSGNKDGSWMFEVDGCGRKVVIIRGRKLEYERKAGGRDEKERDVMTVVEFTAEEPHGKGICLLNVTCGGIQVKEEWFVMPGIIIIIITMMMNKELNVVLLKEDEEEECSTSCECVLGLSGEEESYMSYGGFGNCVDENEGCGGVGGFGNCVDENEGCGGCGGCGGVGGGCGGVGGKCGSRCSGGGGCSN